MKAINSEIRSTRILYFWLSYAGVVALLGISLYLNLRKIPELALERNQSTAAEINHFLAETDRLDEHIKALSKQKKSTATDLQTIFGFIGNLQLRYDKPFFRSVMKAYEVYVSELGTSRSLQDEEWTQLVIKYNQLMEEKKQLEQQLQELQKQRLGQ
jgi:flagellar biosynthesis chaperone FliJ